MKTKMKTLIMALAIGLTSTMATGAAFAADRAVLSTTVSASCYYEYVCYLEGCYYNWICW